MGNFSQWHTAIQRNGVKRVTWCCGTQQVLIEEVIDTTRKLLNVSAMDYVSMSAGESSDKEIWAAANQYPMVPGANRLILVRNVQKIKRWNPLEDWLSRTRELPTVYLLFVTNAERLDYGPKDDDGHRELRPPALWIRSRGSLVECVSPNETDAIAWIRRQVQMDERVAGYLLTRVGGNLSVASSLCKKIRLFSDNGAQPSEKVIDVLCSEMPSDSFVELLLTMQRKEALLAAEKVPLTEVGKVIGLLESRLELLRSIRKALIAGATLRDIKSSAGIESFQAKPYWHVARNYDNGRVAYRRRVLAVVDEAYHMGVKEGLLEVLTALW